MAEGRAALIHRQGEVERVRVADADAVPSSPAARSTLITQGASAWIMSLVVFALCAEE